MDKEKLKILHQEGEIYHMEQMILDKLCDDLKNQLEYHFIEALKRKGFIFNSKIDMEKFILKRCRCEDNIELKEKIYYVDDIPFFLHVYKSGDLQISRENTISADLGFYSYL